MNADFENVIMSAWAETLRKTVQAVIAKHVGYGLDTEIQQIIKSQAIKMIESDSELQGMIHDAMKSWISTQTAEDFRRERDKRRSY